MAGTLTVDTIQSDSSYASTLNVASKMNFAAGMQIGGQDTTFGGMRNRIINGDMRIAQRGTSFTPGANAGAYTLDRWEYNAFSTTGTYSVAQSSTVPNGNFTYSSLLTVTATVAPSSNDYYFYQTKIEGYNIADLGWGTANAQAATVSFWVRSSVTGTYSFHLINAGISLSYVATFTIAAANTWQYVTLTIPGPTTGTWNTTNGVGIYAGIDLGQGSGRQTTANTWSSGASFYCGTSSNVQWINNSGATLYITGVQLEKGSAATAFENRQYGTELQLCQRYFTKSFATTTAPANNTAAPYEGVGASFLGGYFSSNFVPFPVTMRAVPTMTYFSSQNGTPTNDRWQIYDGGWANGSSLNGSNITVNGFQNSWVYSSATLKGAYYISGHFTASTEL